MDLNFDPKRKIVTILDSGEIEIRTLYSEIRKWEETFDGMTHRSLVDAQGNIELPDGKRTPVTMIMLNGWRLAVADSVTIIDGYVSGRDEDNKFCPPFVEGSAIQILLSHEDPAELVRRIVTARPSVSTAREVSEAARRRFTTTPAAVIAEAHTAKATVVALQTLIIDLRLNAKEAGETQLLLEKQVESIDSIIGILESDGDAEAAEHNYRQLLGDVLEALLRAVRERSVMKGLLAAAAISLTSLAGVSISPVVQMLIAGSIVGSEVVAEIRKIASDLKGNEK